MKNSKQSNYIKSYENLCLDPYWVTGFADGEGYFYIRIRKNSKSKLGWSVELGFGLHIHKKDRVLLQAIQNSLQEIGNVTNNGEKAVQFQVSSIKDLRILINHFDNYPLITQKLALR